MGSGFDVLALAISNYRDRLYVEFSERDELIVEGEFACDVPDSWDDNVVGFIADKFRELYSLNKKYRIRLVKGVPVGVGLGSSGASSVAAAAALYALHGFRASKYDVLRLAAYGEELVAGSKHYDNISASLYGWIVVSRADGEPLVIRPPDWLGITLLIPRQSTGMRYKTRYARELVPKKHSLQNVVENLRRVAHLVAGLTLGDPSLFSYGLKDFIAEPYRRTLIRDYDEIISICNRIPSIYGCTISGAGPSIIIYHNSRDDVSRVIAREIRARGLPYEVMPANIGSGAEVRVLE